MSPRRYTLKISVVSILTSLSVATRIFMTFIPNVSLTTPLTILSGLLFGPFTGFMVGFLSMVISDIYIGFGPWTMATSISMGFVGIVSGLLISRAGDKTLIFIFSYLATLMYDVLTSILTVSLMLGAPVYVALVNLFSPVFIGFIPYPMGPVHEFTTSLIVTYMVPLVVRNGYIRVLVDG